MDKSIAIGLGIIILIAGAAYALFGGTTVMQQSNRMVMEAETNQAMNENTNQMEAKNEAMEQNEMMMPEKEMMMDKKMDSMMMSAGTYETYDASKLAQAASGKDVVLFFRAPWCPSCQKLHADIEAALYEHGNKFELFYPITKFVNCLPYLSNNSDVQLLDLQVFPA